MADIGSTLRETRMRERIDINPLRAFDSDDEGTRGVMASAPAIVAPRHATSAWRSARQGIAKRMR